jgi:hypothetical protein
VSLHTGLLEKWEFKMFSNLKLKLQDVTGESLSSAKAQRINRDTAGTFFNILEKVATNIHLSDTPGNFFNTDKIGIQINNKPDSLIRVKGQKYSENIDNITVIASCHAVPCCNIQIRQQ